MNFTNVQLILAREVRDELRDRRTLFMIFVLPILLYPLLGTVSLKMIQFQTQNAMNVLVLGGRQLTTSIAADRRRLFRAAFLAATLFQWR